MHLIAVLTSLTFHHTGAFEGDERTWDFKIEEILSGAREEDMTPAQRRLMGYAERLSDMEEEDMPALKRLFKE